MSFEPAGNFLWKATEKYNLSRQAKASLVCERVKHVFGQQFPDFQDLWNPCKFYSEGGVLFVQVSNSSASSELFLRTHELLEIFMGYDFPQKIEEIRIVKKQEHQEL